MESQCTEMPTFVELAGLDPEKLQRLENTLAVILALPIARDTYAQLIDGRRTWQSYVDSNTYGFRNEVMIVSDHPDPSEEALQLYEEIRTNFTAQDLKIDVKVAQKYQNVLMDSPEYNLRLLEMTGASLHTLGGMMYLACHPETEPKPQEKELKDLSPEELDLLFYQRNQGYVDFYHREYQEFKRYPFGLLNVVGYWVETEILGGVLLFDRGESGLEFNDAFLHPKDVFHAYRLTSQQISIISDLNRLANCEQPPDAPNLLPFTQEPNAHIEETWVRAGEKPLRIYKNDYDKPPIVYIPSPDCCIRSHDEGLPFDEARRIAEGNGWDKVDHRL